MDLQCAPPGNGRVAVARPSAPLLRRRALAEIKQIELVRDRHAQRLAVLPLLAEELVGADSAWRGPCCFGTARSPESPSRTSIRHVRPM